jgi:GDPmannose 4,6-dehydratase
MKRALITGITGQDGAYLSQYLLQKGYKVYGTFRRISTPNFWRLQSLGIYSKINLIPADLLDMGSMIEAVRVSDPDEIYNMAASSYVGTSFEQAIGNAEITGLAVTKFLEAIKVLKVNAKFYQASSSEMYGNNGYKIQDEQTPFYPASPYAVAKLYAHRITDVYRNSYKMFAVSGILFNHESPLRGIEFVSRKISNGVAEIAFGLKDKLVLGNLYAKRDWGYAAEYMKAVHLMLQQDKPEDFVISTGDAHSVLDFVRLAFEIVGLNWKKYVKTDKRFFRPFDVDYLCGNNKKARRKLDWNPTINFEKLVELMVKEDLSRWKMFVEGKTFPWDAPLYPNEAKLITRSSDESINSKMRKNRKVKRRSLRI